MSRTRRGFLVDFDFAVSIREAGLMQLGVTGHRDIDEKDRDVIDSTIEKHVEFADRLYFGGARGTDTRALKSADQHRDCSDGTQLIGVVPWGVDDQPKDSGKVLQTCADRILELEVDLPVGIPRGYFKRNQALVDRSDQLLAFWDGKESGGTYRTIQYARNQDVPVRTRSIG
jgi:hypothetical protein